MPCPLTGGHPIKRLALTVATVVALTIPSPALSGPPQSKKDRQVIRFFVHHPRLADTPAGRRALWRVLAHVTDQLRRLQSARAWPAHHSLWLCIHSGEGAWDDPNSGGNGHYGGLQMHPGWGYGTSFYANEDSELVQEQAAERGYRASGLSHAWLEGQWGQTIGPCWGYA